jgi:hypothetical protein
MLCTMLKQLAGFMKPLHLFMFTAIAFVVDRQVSSFAGPDLLSKGLLHLLLAFAILTVLFSRLWFFGLKD